jgi:hypothetical protein
VLLSKTPALISLDEPGVTKVMVSLEYRGRNKALLAVEDDAPEGFKDLSHAFTLFADSAKTTNPEQRGRFNLGEKLLLAISDEVTIRTTKGGIRFDAEGRHTLRTRQYATHWRSSGPRFRPK